MKRVEFEIYLSVQSNHIAVSLGRTCFCKTEVIAIDLKKFKNQVVQDVLK